MKPIALLLVLGSVPFAFGVEEKTVVPRIESVGLFKNGLAVVSVEFPIEAAGSYVWEKVPQAVHGSLWVESDGEVSIRSTMRMIETTDAAEAPGGRLQNDLAGKNVSLKVVDGTHSEKVEGRVWEIPISENEMTWNTDYNTLNANQGSYHWFRNQAASQRLNQTPNTGNFLVIESPGGSRRYVSQSSITMLDVEGPFAPATRTEERPVMVFDVAKAPAVGGKVRISYLAKGLAWLPSYRLDLSDSKSLVIRQNAVIRNEMTDFEEAEVQLISGFPNVEFGGVDSPMWQGTGLSSFFQQLSGSGNSSFGITSNRISSQMASYNSAPRGNLAPLPDVSEVGMASNDIHYESIGGRSMKAGDSLSLDVAAAEADYERVVEWTVQDTRNERGRYDGNTVAENTAWDAVRFTNPFKFPMTTAPALVVEQGKFRGQSLSEWVNPGQETCLRVTKALSIRTEARETEEEGERQIVFIGGNDYRRTTVKGELTIRNYRAKEISMAIRAEFSGKMLEADGKPKTALRPEGVPSVNPRRQLEWSLDIPAGGEKTLTYRYEVLVDH